MKIIITLIIAIACSAGSLAAQDRLQRRIAPVDLKADTSEPVKHPCRSVPTDLETGTAIYNAIIQRKGALDNYCTNPQSVSQRLDGTCSIGSQRGTVILEVQAYHPAKKRGKWDRRVGKLRVMRAVWASDRSVCTLGKLRAQRMRCTMPAESDGKAQGFLVQSGQFCR